MTQTASLSRFFFLGRRPGSAPSSVERDARIDVIRGLALLIIFINHMPGNVVSAYMPHNFGFSDAADIFVLLAGVSATLAYGGLIERRGLGVGALKIGARVWTLYIAHLAVFIIVCGVVAAAVTRTQNPLYVEAINIQPFFSDTFEALVDALMLRYQPSYLDILPLYIVLLAAFPLVYLAVRISPAGALLISLTIWQTAVWFGLNLTNVHAAGWFFNPFAWQVVFVLGVIIGQAARNGITAPRLLWLDALAFAFIAFGVIAKTSTGNPFGVWFLSDWLDLVQLGSDKTNLAWSRVFHVVALAWLAIRWLPAGAGLLSHAAGRTLAVVGRHSLDVFCAGTVLAIIGQIVMAETGFALVPQLLVCLTGVTLLIGLGMFLTWYQSITLPGAKDAPAPSRRASAQLH
ncbi:OpgC domain-containing protein [Bosea sp. Root381]|uniref:OpgC family protein n=1 Tax=Bosea sp. Root381 TaxID=1736524 RepID=UPI000A79D911|nr:OpgC domain-containing protein [Bosea sp. Root381]